jgi:hypothetical protein
MWFVNIILQRQRKRVKKIVHYKVEAAEIDKNIAMKKVKK